MFYYVNGVVAETGPNLAVIDCLFNCGPRAAEILRSSYAL